MYQALLTRRYLSSKIMPLLAAIAVMLCTAVVLLVWSIMGGFLVMLVDAGKGIVGDVAIQWPTAGFAYYDDLVERLEADPEVRAATPLVETFGMLGLPDGRLVGVKIQGIDPDSYARVTDYAKSLYWQPTDGPAPTREGRGDWRADNSPLWEFLYRDGLTLHEPDPETGRSEPAVVPGIEVAGFSLRDPETGLYRPADSVGVRTDNGIVWGPGFLAMTSVTLNVVPVDRTGRPIEVVTRSFPVANEFRTEIFQIDSSTVLMPLDELQRLLRMDEAEVVRQGPTDYGGVLDDSLGAPQVIDIAPARVTTIFVRGSGRLDPSRLAERCWEIYRDFEADHPGQVPQAGSERGARSSIQVTTWEQRQGMLIGAVQKEIALVLLILLVISFTASFLILAIFWAMVSEKTRDIGILRSLGATRAGVAWLWLRYAIAIGLIGSLAGGALATLIVWNINPIHTWLGTTFGLVVWDPKVYYFSKIPNDVEPAKAAIVVLGGLGFSLLGAMIPAIRAAFLRPVEALRFE